MLLGLVVVAIAVAVVVAVVAVAVVAVVVVVVAVVAVVIGRDRVSVAERQKRRPFGLRPFGKKTNKSNETIAEIAKLDEEVVKKMNSGT